MKKKEKLKYVPPVIEVRRVVLEGFIAVSTKPIRGIKLEEWETDVLDANSHSDIVLNW